MNHDSIGTTGTYNITSEHVTAIRAPPSENSTVVGVRITDPFPCTHAALQDTFRLRGTYYVRVLLLHEGL